MFKNIGNKIKILAVVLFWLALASSIILGVITILQGVGNVRNDSYSMVTAIIQGFLIIGGGFLTAWLGNFLLYGFGELVDSNQKILKILEEKNK